jgi:tetratricopeptide (TPR) repeat protein
MFWIAAATTAVILVMLFYFFAMPIRQAVALSAAAQRACKAKNFPAAVELCRRSHQAAGQLKEPQRSRIEAKLELQLATLLYRQGRMREAEDLFLRGFAHTRTAGCYPEMKPAYMVWGDLCADEDRHAEAEQYYRLALQGEEQIGNCAAMVFVLQRLGDSLIQQGRREDAEEVIEGAIELETEIVKQQMVRQGKDPAIQRVVSWSRPDLEFCRQRYEEARQLYREKVVFWETSGTRPANIDLGHLQMRLAVSEIQTGHLTEALETYTRAQKTFEREWGEGHPKAVSAREAKAALTRRLSEAAGS